MARRKRDTNPTTAQINRLLDKYDGDKSQVVAHITGTRDGSGMAKTLTAHDLAAIGFSDKFILDRKGHLPRSGADAERGKGGGGGGGTRPSGGGGSAGPTTDPQTDYYDWLKEQQLGEKAKYDQDAIASLQALFKTYGLESLAPLIAQWVQAGMGEAAIVAQLRETDQYKQRFPGMQALRANGYNAISEAEYLQLEDSYHQALQGAGLPAGFYDNPQDFVKFISNGVDPSEVKMRANAAVEMANQVDPSQRELLSSMYGVNTGDLAAYFLDPKRAAPLLQKQLGTVQVANAARKAGVQADFSNRARFERLVDNGIGAEQAQQGYSQIAQEFDPLKNLSEIWGGGPWNLDTAENATFFGNADATKKRKRLVATERAAFSGASGFDARVSGRGSSAGSF